MTSPLKGILGSRVMPVTLPKSSLNPITHLVLTALSLEIVSTTKHNEATKQDQSAYVKRLSLAGISSFNTQPAPGFDAASRSPYSVPNGGSGGGAAGGTGGGQVTIPGYVEPVADEGGDVVVADAEEPFSNGGGLYQVAGGTQQYAPGAEPYVPGGGGFGYVVQTDSAPPFPTDVSQPTVTQISVTVIDAIAGAVYFQLANRGKMPLAATVEVRGRFGDLELFSTPPVKRTFPPNLKPVKYKSEFKFEGEDAGYFWKAIQDEAGPTSKATVVLDALIKWNFFNHKITDARPVGVVGFENL